MNGTVSEVVSRGPGSAQPGAMQRPDFSDPRCSAVLVKLMDASARRKWRLLSRACCQDVYLSTKTLSWLLGGHFKDGQFEDGQEPHPDHAEALEEAIAMAKRDVEFAVSAAGATAAAASTASLAAAAVQGTQLQVSRLHGVTLTAEVAVQLDMGREVAKAAARHARTLVGAYAAHGVRVKVSVAPWPHELPERLLRKLPGLRTLSCRGMEILSLDGLPPSLRLDRLDISYTGTVLSAPASRLALLRCSGLRALVARGLHVEQEDVQAVCCLAGSLQELDLSEMDDDLDKPLPALEQLLSLRCLAAEMRDGPMLGYGETLMALLPGLRLMGQLTSLRLGGLLAMVQAEEAKGVPAALGAALRRLPQLQELSLWVSEEFFDEDAAEQQVGAAVYGAVAPALAEARPPLRRLLLGNSMMGAAGVAALALALPALAGTLEVLRLEGSLMGPEGAAALAAALAGLTALRELDLASNRLTGGTTLALAPALAGLRELRVLCLASNALGAAGAAMLASHVTGLSRLQELLLGNNQLYRQGVMALLPALPSLPALRLLDVGHNSLDSPSPAPWGVAELRAAAPGLTELRTGSRWASCIGYGPRRQLTDASLGNGAGMYVDISDSDGTDTDGSISSGEGDIGDGSSSSDDDDDDDDGDDDEVSSGDDIDSGSDVGSDSSDSSGSSGSGGDGDPAADGLLVVGGGLVSSDFEDEDEDEDDDDDADYA